MDMSTPLGTAPLHILLAISDGPVHGYGILQSVRERSGGTLKLGTGSLYRHLSKLIAAGCRWLACSHSALNPFRRAQDIALLTSRRAIPRPRKAGSV